jgi:nucleotide-binding universal stress UspA family protein
MYQRILVPVDGSSTSQRGLAEAISLARLTQGRLRLLHVIDELSFALAMDAYSGHSGDWLGALRESGQRLLEEGKSAAEAAGIGAETVLCDTFSGAVHEMVTAEARKWPADLIVLGTHGRRGVGRLVLGSSAEHILRFAPVPVLLVRAPESEANPERASDGSHARE